jgi:hypothetical protein
MAKFKSKMVEIDAVRVMVADYSGQTWDGPPFSEMPGWLSAAIETGMVVPVTPGSTDYAEWEIRTLEGTMLAGPGDWIICDTEGTMFTPLAVNVSENAPIDVSLGVPTIFDFEAGGTAIWTGVNSCGNIREGHHPDATDARGDVRARPMRHLQVFDRRPTEAGACPSCARPPPARAHHAAGRARADRAARAVT